jgi:hypothetical protein
MYIFWGLIKTENLAVLLFFQDKKIKEKGCRDVPTFQLQEKFHPKIEKENIHKKGYPITNCIKKAAV